ADVLRDDFGLTADARRAVAVNQAEVPKDLRCLIPSVERWAISCDVRRGDYFSRQSKADIAELWHQALPFVERICLWLKSQPADVRQWSDAAGNFSVYLKAHQEAVQQTPDDLKRIENNRAK